MDILVYNVKQTKIYMNTALLSEKPKLLQNLFEELSAYIVLKGRNKAKYKLLVRGFVNQYSLKNSQYPKTMQVMTNACLLYTSPSPRD